MKFKKDSFLIFKCLNITNNIFSNNFLKLGKFKYCIFLLLPQTFLMGSSCCKCNTASEDAQGHLNLIPQSNFIDFLFYFIFLDDLFDQNMNLNLNLRFFDAANLKDPEIQNLKKTQ